MQEQTRLPELAEIVAEGSSGPPKNIEPVAVIQTAELPVVSNDTGRKLLASETGVSVAVEVNAEGPDDADTQDSSSISGEIKPVSE